MYSYEVPSEVEEKLMNLNERLALKKEDFNDEW